MFYGAMPLNSVLGQHINVQYAARMQPDAYGIEVELEGKNICNHPDELANWWTQHKDGSLRQLHPGSQCTEYVTIMPQAMAQTETAIFKLFEFLNSPNVEVFESYRTSIHVHVNFGMETLRTIYNMMTLSLIFDELLVSQNGEHRIGNNFCLRAKDALGQVVSLVSSIESGNNFFSVSNHERYSSINFISLLKFGSIEFRSLECTTDAGRLLHWIGTLARLKEMSKTYKNPIEIIQEFSKLQPMEFLTHILGPFSRKYSRVPDAEQMLHNGMRIAQDLAFASAWKEAKSE